MTSPILRTRRLNLRGWRSDDLGAYAAMLADPATARFITRRRTGCSSAESWAEMAFHAGHWNLRGFGMFVIEHRETGAFLGRAGPIEPHGWPAAELAWALAPGARGQGFATEAAAAAAEWAFGNCGIDEIISVIHPDNHASQRVAERLGAARSNRSFAPFGEPCDIWTTSRETLLKRP